MIYLKKHPENIGPFEVRVEPINEEPYYVEITSDPKPFTRGISAGLLSKYPRHIVEEALEDVPEKFRHPSDIERLDCPEDDCDKDYANQANLDKHIKSTHGSLWEKLVEAIS